MIKQQGNMDNCSFAASLIFDVSFFAYMNVGIVGISIHIEHINNLNIGYLFALFYVSHYKLCWNNIEIFIFYDATSPNIRYFANMKRVSRFAREHTIAWTRQAIICRVQRLCPIVE